MKLSVLTVSRLCICELRRFLVEVVVCDGLDRVERALVASVVVAVCRLPLWKERLVGKEVSPSEQAYGRRLFRMKCELRFGGQDGLCDSLGRAECKGRAPCGKETFLHLPCKIRRASLVCLLRPAALKFRSIVPRLTPVGRSKHHPSTWVPREEPK